jgi:integrase
VGGLFRSSFSLAPPDFPEFAQAVRYGVPGTPRNSRKRRLKAAGLPGHFSPYSFRVTTVTDLLDQNVPLEDVQYLAGHSDPRTTRIYDRRRRKVTRNIVERISI